MQQPFIAKILFSISCDDIFTEQYEEQLRLVFSEDASKAVNIAKQIGTQEEGNFIDRRGRMIGWKFIAVKDVTKVSLEQGALLHSSIKETEPVGWMF